MGSRGDKSRTREKMAQNDVAVIVPSRQLVFRDTFAASSSARCAICSAWSPIMPPCVGRVQRARKRPDTKSVPKRKATKQKN